MKKDRIAWIDMLKGLAIILVVVGHNASETVSNFIYCFHMPLFFLLSGFVFSPKDPKVYLRRSWNRLMVPYIFFTIVIMIPDLLSLLIRRDLLGCCKLAYRIIYGGKILRGAYGVLWFVTGLWIAQNIFNLIVARNLSIYVFISLLVIAYIFSLIRIPLPWNIHVVPMALAYIWIGNLAKRYLTNVNRGGVKMLLSIALLILIFYLRNYIVLDMKNNDYGLTGISLISSVLASSALAVIVMCMSNIRIVCKVLGFIGSASMVIMYQHQPFKFLVLNRLNIYTSTFIQILAGIAFSVLIYVILSNFRFTRRFV